MVHIFSKSALNVERQEQMKIIVSMEPNSSWVNVTNHRCMHISKFNQSNFLMFSISKIEQLAAWLIAK